MECIYFSDPPIHNAEDVDEDEEQSYEERHPPRHNFRRDEEADPGHDHEEARRQVVHCHVFELIPDERHLETGEGEVVTGRHVEFMPLFIQGIHADGVLEDDGAPFGVIIELHRVVVDGAGVVGGVHQQLAVMRVQWIEIKSNVE